MRKLGVVAAIAATLTALGATSAQAGAQGGAADPAIAGLDSPDRIAGQYIVVLDENARVSPAAATAERAFGATVGNVYRSAIHGYSARMSQAAAERLAQTPAVKSVQADTRVTATAQSLPTGINRANADASPTAAIDGADSRVNADVAVIDTGVDLDHPDLNVYRAGARNCALLGVSPDDQNGHGSHVAGTIGALDNTSGVVGMAPGARIWPVKVLNAAGVGSTSDVICGIDYVTANADQIEVANMSLGGGGEDDGNCGETNNDAQHQAICASVAAGVTYVVAAGNDSADAANSTPAAYDEVITVSALADFNGQPGGGAASTCRSDVDDTFANFSNYGADVDLIAPGTCIHSTWMNGGYDTISGTSMASPHVAGGAALYLANNPGATPAQVQSALESAGSSDWNATDDPDSTKEPLLDVTGF
ncbi:MAG TPA: S8 family serine peptidase [Nocardioidaceae bacterium]|nr:S8 family serine peptidase [Nocardioidaceae bacterium]